MDFNYPCHVSVEEWYELYDTQNRAEKQRALKNKAKQKTKKKMAWCRTGERPPSEPMMAWVIDAYMRYPAIIC